MTNSAHPKSSISALALAAISLTLLADWAQAQEAAKPAPLPPLSVETTGKKKSTPVKKAAPAKKKSAPVAASPAPAPPAPAEVAEPAPASDPSTQEAGDADGGLSSGGVDGYRATRTATGTKTDTPLIDIPQAITVITAERAQDQHATDVNKALLYVPGVTVAQGESNRDQIVIRGQSTTADFFVDGVRDDGQYFRDLYNADRLEVLKGPNAMIFGRGGGGGVVNRVTKKAGETHYEGHIEAGSWDHYRATADVGAKVTNDFAVRLNGIAQDSGSFRDGVSLERYGINPTVFLRPEENTRIWLSYEYFDDRRTADRGIPSADPADLYGRRRPYGRTIKDFFGDPDLSVSDFEGHSATATIEHKFTPDLKVRNHTYFSDFDKFYQNVFPSSQVFIDNTYNVQAYNNTLQRASLINQTDVNWRIKGDWWGHTIAAGTEFGYQDTRSFRFDGQFQDLSTTLVGVSAFNPTINVPIRFTLPANDTQTSLHTSSAYIQDQFDITRYLQIIGGVRFDRFDLDAFNLRTKTEEARVDDVWSPRVGVVLKPVEQVALYASYSKSFLPATGDQFTGLTLQVAELEPEEFINREVGFKWNIAPRLMLQGALFKLDRENTRIADPLRPGFFLATGASRTEGGELEITGNVTEDWQIAGGYARTFAEVTRLQGTGAVPVPIGTELPNVPEDMFTLWNRYQLTDMWGVGVGVIHRSEMFASLSNTTVLPSYTRVDAALFFKLNENFDAQLNVENVFDEEYYASSHTDNNISPGSPRAFYVGLTSRY